jgi:hypothetical protein
MTEKQLTRNRTRSAVKSGKLIKQPCEVCGTTKGVEAHHQDYSNHLDVKWLCKAHHLVDHGGDFYPEGRVGPQICALCHEVTEDGYALETPLDLPVICEGCRSERQLFVALKAFGCLTDDGNLTSQLEVILKRHYPRQYAR